jgi:hypothetical protein
MQTIINRRSNFALFLAVFALGGCANAPERSATGKGGEEASPEEVPVEGRAVARWEALIAKRGMEAYDYLSPGVRSTKTREAYAAEMGSRPVKWLSVAFDHKECDGDRCTVWVNIEYEVKMPGYQFGTVKSNAGLEERWIRLEGAWYHVPNEYLEGGLR